MKHVKQLATLLLALTLVLALATPALAAMEGTLTDGSITISNAVPGQSYSIYQILYLESYSTDEEGKPTGAYAYKANSAWASWLATQTEYVSIDKQGYVTWVENADAAAFAKLAQAEATKEGSTITADATATAPAAAEGATTSTVKFENLNLGYYLVDTTLGTLCSLDTTDPNVEMREKNKKPTNEKEVQEDSDGTYDKVNDADIGQTVNFRNTVTLPVGSVSVVFRDTMSVGLSLIDNSIIVYTDSNLTTLLDTNSYTVNTNPGDGYTFTVAFAQEYLDGLEADATVYVTYSAVVNANAVVGGNGNPNDSDVKYSNGPSTTSTPKSTTKTYTWEFDVLKYGNGNKGKKLAGAKFVLLNSDETKVAVFENGKMKGWVNVPDPDEGNGTITWPDGSEMTTNTDGKIIISGLDADTYYLRETKQPDGYNKLDADVEVKIEPEKSTDGLSLTLEPVTAKINNQSGTELPSTGGIGTTIFYVVGSILLVGAAVLLIVKKRVSAAD